MRARLRDYLFLAPYAALFVTFVALPVALGFWMSLHDWAWLGPVRWAGLMNYARLFEPHSASAHEFWQSMAATALFVAVSVPPLVLIPLALALLLNAPLPGRTFFRALFFAPYTLGVAVIGILWRFLLDPSTGVVNHVLGAAIPWTTELPWVWVSLVAVTVWWTLGLNTLIYLAGLQDIPKELYEAARLDGAGPASQFLHVTLPGLRPVAVLVATLTFLASANMFGQAYLVTSGAPAHATRTAVMAIAQEGLVSFRLGQAAAMGFVLAVILAVAGVAARRFITEEA
jgi:multiple sugar transport system permease protein